MMRYHNPSPAQGFLCFFDRTALPLTYATLTYLSGVLRRHRRTIGLCQAQLNPASRPLLVLVHLREGETFASWRWVRGRHDSLAGQKST